MDPIPPSFSSRSTLKRCRFLGATVHGPAAAMEKTGLKVKPYDIPLRALIAKDVDGLMMAGRCISGDFIAHASYRVTGNAAAMGEAAGAISALAATTRRFPHEVEWSEGVAMLRKLGQRV